MSLKDLPKSLVDSVTEIVTDSNRSRDDFIKNVFEQGLKTFNVNSITELSESDQKVLYSWAFNKINETTSSTIQEDDMPGDATFHKNNDESSDKKTEMDESCSTNTETDITENIAITPAELHTNTAVGVRDATTAMPVHADVLKDSSPVDGKTEYRLFVQFNTNTMPVIVPPVGLLPGAPSIAALKEIVEGLPYYGDVVQKAIQTALDVPSEQPQFQGNDRA